MDRYAEVLAQLEDQAESAKYIHNKALTGDLTESPLTPDEVRAWMLVVVKVQMSAVAGCVEVLREEAPQAAARLEGMEMELRSLIPRIEER